MTVPSHFHMPGAFHAEGVHPGLFRPPHSPSASTSLSYATARSVTPYDSHTKRKRYVEEISRSQEDSRYNILDGDGYFATPVAQSRVEDRRYYLAGQLDTPSSGPMDSGILDESMYSDSDYRRALGSKRPHDEMSRSMSGPMPLFNLPNQPMPSQGWGSFAFNTIGGVVGRVWEFCKTGAFRGFHAGGGRGFSMTPVGIAPEPDFDEKLVTDHRLPGLFPQQENYFGNSRYVQEPEEPFFDSRASTPTAPAAKRRHTDRRDDLGRNWVMVSGEAPAPAAAAEKKTPQPRRPFRPSPRSRNTAPSMATGRRISVPTSRLSTTPMSNLRRPSSRLSQATSPSIPPPRPSTASFASPRSPSPSKIPQPSHNRRRSTVTSPTPTPSFSHRRTNSSASSASAHVTKVASSPRLGKEAKHLAARRKNEDREADVRMSALNKQLQDMIRQGKEALGTTFEVEGNWDDE